MLPILYESLCNQTKKSFEWIIIDDGSCDNTDELVGGWINENPPFEINYKKKENGGKHRAINDAVKMARYEWFFTVDSDDFLPLDAIERIQEWIKTIEHDTSFFGVQGLCEYISTGNQVGEYPSYKKHEEFIDCTNLQRKKFHLRGDKKGAWRTNILRKYPFQEFEGENFLTESTVWNKIAHDGYKVRWCNEVIYKCEYLEDGLTKAGNDKRIIENFEGFTYQTRLIMTTYTRRDGLWWERQLAISHYFYMAKKKGLKFTAARQKLEISTGKAYMALLLSKIFNAVHVYKESGIRGVFAKIRQKARNED